MSKKIYLFIVILILSFSSIGERVGSKFKATQLQFERVKTAYKEKENLIKNELKVKQLSLSNIHILLCVYKQEKALELWVKSIRDKKYTLLKTYDICASSGIAGPKRKEGDQQVPEGFYTLNRFNPASNFYLSLGVSYPNESDRILSKAARLGGDIFIHGNCVTIGCMPLTDDKIKELYIYAIEAKNNLQREIPVYIFPARVNSENWKNLLEYHKSDKAITSFWNNLKTGYDLWDQTKKQLQVNVNKEGKYKFE